MLLDFACENSNLSLKILIEDQSYLNRNLSMTRIVELYVLLRFLLYDSRIIHQMSPAYTLSRFIYINL